jgi:hypothetical protein
MDCAPVLLTVFNRPSETRQALVRLKQVRPKKIFVAADGPRDGRVDDIALCDEVRRLVIEQIDWPTALLTDFSPHNLGLRRRITSAITWALKLEDRVIILEDDCIPNASFFEFCTELLDFYEADRRVGVITGDNFQPSGFECGATYYFSRYPHCWGWATWRRAWDLYDDQMGDWPELRRTDWLEKLFPDPLEALYWKKIFDDTHAGKIQTWDYQWTYANWRHGLLTATPSKNLVTNIGTGPCATNTRDAEHNKHGQDSLPLDFPLLHPRSVTRDKDADNYAQLHAFGRAKDRSLTGRLKRLCEKVKRKCLLKIDSFQGFWN